MTYALFSPKQIKNGGRCVCIAGEIKDFHCHKSLGTYALDPRHRKSSLPAGIFCNAFVR